MYITLADINQPTYTEVIAAILLIVNFVMAWVSNRKLNTQSDHLKRQDKQIEIIHVATNSMSERLENAAFQQGKDNPTQTDLKR